MYNEGHAEAVSNWDKYQKDEQALTNLNNALQNNGQTITDNAERQKIADKVLKDSSERAKEYGNQIVANTKTLSDFKKENEVENPNKQVKPKFTDGLKSFASSALSSIGNAVISAGTAMIAQQLISWGLQGIDAIVHYDDNIIAKGQEAKESIQSQTKAYEDQKASLGELTTKYTELSKGVKISGNSIKNISLTDDEYKDFLDTSNQIAAAAPSLTRSWDSQGNAILNAGTNAEDLNTQVNDYLKLQRNLTYYDTKKNISDQYKGYETTLKNNKEDLDSYQKNFDIAQAKVEKAQEFEKALNKANQKSKKFTYIMDQDTLDSLDVGEAIEGTTPYGDKVEVTFDLKKLNAQKNSLGEAIDSYSRDMNEAQTNLTNVKEINAAAGREMVSSIKSMASTIDSFDSWDDQDKASEFQSQLNNMLNSTDNARLLNNFKESGKDMDTWLRNNVVNPMATATPDQQKLWSQLFEMEPKDQETVREFAARRDDVLESIADISQSDFWTKGTLAEAFGFAHTEYDDNDKAYTVWENQDSLNRVRDALKGAKASKTKGDAEKVREDLKNATQDELEIAVQVITDNKDLSSIDDFYTAFEKAKQAAKDMSDQAAVSLDSMETKVSTAKSTLSSMGTILTETTSAGGISKDNVKILSTAFKDVKDPRGIEQNVNDLFTTTSDGIKLNIDALKTFTEYQAEATDGDFEKGIKLQTKAIKDQTDVTNKAKKAWEKARGTEDEDDKKAAYDSEKDKLKDARNEYLSYMQSQSEWQATKKQQQELLSYYSQWQRAQSTENAGDKYNNIVAGLKNAKDAYDKGLVGTDDFKSFAALISPTGSDDRANFAENYGKAVRYLTEDKTGVNNFLADLKSKGMASYDDASKRWSFDIDDMSKAARSMGISKEFMSANFGRLRDYGIDNNFISSTEEGIDRVQELTSALSDEQKRLEELKNTDSTNTTAITASEDKVNKYKQDLKETYDNMGDYSEDAAQTAVDNFNSAAMGVQSYQNAIENVKKNENLTEAQRTSAINQLIAKQEELAATYGTTVKELLGADVSSLMDGIITDNTLDQATQDANAAFETLQQAQTDSKVKLVDTDNIQTAEDQLLKMSNDDITAKVDVEADTSEAESDIENLQNVSGSTVTLNCDVSNEGSFEQAKSTIESMPSDTTATIDMEVNGEEDVEKATELIESAPTNGAKLVVDCEVNNKEEFDELMQAQSTANSKGANVEVHASIKGVDVDSAATADTEVPVKGKLEIEPYSGDAVEVNAKANITGVTGGEGVQVSLNAKANVTEAPTVPDTTVKATAHVDEAPTVPDAEGIANYEGIFPHVADDAYGVAHYEGDFPTSAPTISGTVNYYAHIIGAPSGGAIATASGTMTSVAHASGTAYNVLNMRPLSSAHAKGDVALKHDEQAIVNEVGINGHSESIVRDGVWSLIPGGAHIENLKKGDIIFSATQTEDLLKHGATHGHARAYAQGTASGVTLAPAYADGTSELDDTIKKVSTQAKDWIETALDRLERIVEKYQDIAESDYSNYKSSEKNYDKALKNLNKQLQTQKDSRAKYVAKANEVASAVGLSDELKKKVQNGTINIESLSEDDKKRVDAYQEWYEKILDCDKAIRELTKSQKDLAKAKVERVIEAYDTVIGKRENKADYYNAKQELRVSQGYNQKPGSKYEKYMKKELYYTNEQKRLTDKEIKEYKGRMKEYLKVNGHKTVDPEYQKMKKQLYSLQTEAVKLENEAAELVQALQDNREQIKQWAVDRWDRAGSKQDAVIDYAKANDNPEYQINEKIYQERIKSNARQINALQKLRAEKAEYYDTHFSSMNNEEAQKYLNSIAQIDEQILKIGSDIENLKNEIMELRWKPFDDAQDKLSNVITEYQTMQKLLGDAESFYNDDGSFTTNGLTNILLTQESIDATKQKIANYREGLNKLEEQYKNGCYSLDEYNEKSKQLLDGIQQESTALSELKQNMLDMYETQIKKENDLLQENIDKRKDALSAKEKYYDYDKTLKKKSKDINTLKSQIAALEGTSNAAAKARLEKLRAELADAEDDMADTMHQHEVDMKNTGYENFSNEANKALDNTLDAVKKNSSFQEAIISGMLTNVTTNYDNTYKHLHTVMDQYGVKVSSTFDTMIGKSADFNTSLIQQIKALETISNMKVTLPYGTSNGQGGSTTGNNTYTNAENGIHNTFNNNKDSTGAGNGTPGTVNEKSYSFSLNKSEIFLTPNESYKLKVTWSPTAPLHSDIKWSSDKTDVAKVSSSGKVTATKGVQTSKGGGVTGVLVGGLEKTFKATITAKSDFGSKTCVVHVMPDAHYDAIEEYANKNGLAMTNDKMQEALEYAYRNGGNHADKADIAVEGFKKAYLNDKPAYLKSWFNTLPNRPDGATDVPAGVSQLVGYFNSKGKKVGPKEMQQLADILEIPTPGVKKYDSWGSALKNQILQKYKSYGFATGGIINKLIPADMSTLLGKAIISNGDQGFIGAKVGESVMTEEFTRLLKPSTPTVIGVYGDKGDPGTTDYNGLQNKPVVNGAVTAYQSDIMKSQLRNVTFSTEEPKTTDGKPGDMWVVYGDE